jgi:lipopolysaccharide biosynthesis glycosyltransferase
MIRIVIGTQANQYVPQRVLEYSIRKHTSAEVEILPTRQTVKRRGGTRFGFVRFCVPSLCGYQGRAVYMDADQLVLGDVAELAASLDDDHAVAVVQAPDGTFGGRPVEPRNETSVMVLACDKLKEWDPDHLFENVVPNDRALRPGQIHYKDFQRLGWLDPALIQPLDPRWNHYNVVRDDTKLVHFSHVRDQPWKRPGHPLTPLWEEWLRETLEAGFLRRGEVLREVARLHLHPHFLRHAWR